MCSNKADVLLLVESTKSSTPKLKHASVKEDLGSIKAFALFALLATSSKIHTVFYAPLAPIMTLQQVSVYVRRGWK